MRDRTSPITDPETLRAIAQPIRLRLYEALVANGPATAARLAQQVPAAPGSLSYHLRILADSGFVEEAPELGTDGRERWWRAVPGGIHWANDDLESSPGAQEVAVAAQSVIFSRQLDRIRTWIREGPSMWSPRWRSAAINIDAVLRLTPEELTAVYSEINAVLVRWRHNAGTSRPSPASGDRIERDDREAVFVLLHAFPFAAGSKPEDTPVPGTRHD